jgi:hypothetical protein
MSEKPKTLQELYAREGTWTKGAYARLPNGEVAAADDKGACCFCLDGGLVHIYGDNTEQYCEALEKVWQTIMKVFSAPKFLQGLKEIDDYCWIGTVRWNDRPERTIEDIRRVVKEANV